MTATEQRISDMENTLTLCWLTSVLLNLVDHFCKLSYLADHLQHNNLRFIGFHKCTEGKEPEHLMEIGLKPI